MDNTQSLFTPCINMRFVSGASHLHTSLKCVPSVAKQDLILVSLCKDFFFKKTHQHTSLSFYFCLPFPRYNTSSACMLSLAQSGRMLVVWD